MDPIHEEGQLFEYPFIIAGKHPLTHFRGFYGLLLERLSGFSYAVYLNEFSESFLENYQGHIICLAAHYAEELCQRKRRYKVILISHGPIPMSWRAPEMLYADHLIDNGSPELIQKIDFSGVKQICTAGYFPTDYFLDQRKEKLALVQMTTHSPGHSWQDRCYFSLREICRSLQAEGFEVCVYNHLMYPSDLSEISPKIRIVQPGLDYIHTLSSCSHFVFTGTSGFITNASRPGCHMCAISTDWIEKNSSLFREVLYETCHVAESWENLLHCLSLPPKNYADIAQYLYGDDRHNVISKINRYLQSLM